MPPRRGNPGLELGLSLGEGWQDGPRQGLRRANPGGFGLWAEQLLAESTGKQGKGLVPGAGRVGRGPDRQAQEVRGPRPLRARAGVLPLGVRDRGRRRDPRDQPVRPAERPGGEGPDDEVLSTRATTRTSSPRARSTSCSRRRPGATTSASRRSSTRARAGARAAGRTGARDGLRRHDGPRSALPPLDRPAPQGRARTRGSSSRSSTTRATSWRSPEASSASAG